jgi:hypothetical protein
LSKADGGRSPKVNHIFRIVGTKEISMKEAAKTAALVPILNIIVQRKAIKLERMKKKCVLLLH